MFFKKIALFYHICRVSFRAIADFGPWQECKEDL